MNVHIPNNDNITKRLKLFVALTSITVAKGLRWVNGINILTP